jgi:MiaB-like tRNA modifying enzyme
VVIYNSCAVKGPTENRIIDDLKRIPKTKKVVIAGCLPLISFQRLVKEVRFNAIAGPALGKDIVEIVQRVLNGENVSHLNEKLKAMPKLDLPRIQSNPIISVIPVNFGCLGSCAFCCVVHARGHLRSYSIAEIVERVKADIASGSRELWITSQDTACYGRDIGTNLAELLKTVTAVEGDFRVRVGMMTPNLVTPFLADLVSAYGNEKVFKFAHLPVQSGDDGVLRHMRRFYTAAEFKETVAAFREAFPEITISTDVIIGFPGETEEAFDNTLNLIREVQPEIVNVSKFFARPKTAAWEMHAESVDRDEIKRRSVKTAELVKQVSLKNSQSWVGWRGEMLVDEKGKVAGSWVGRNFAYKPIVVKSEEELFGKTLRVKIVKAFSSYLLGKTE